MRAPVLPESWWKRTVFCWVAEYILTGTLTSPKLIAPDQIARAMLSVYPMFSGWQAVVGLLLSATSHDLPARRVSSAVKLPPFQKLLDAHGVDVHRFLVALVGPHDADDCYQETWLAALRGYPRLRDAANLR